jgi:hypothetical protein
MASNEESILEEAMAGLREATQRIRAGENGMLGGRHDDQPNYRNLFVRASGAPAMMEAAFLEARRRRGCNERRKRTGAHARGSRESYLGPVKSAWLPKALRRAHSGPSDVGGSEAKET